jgi:hypothetical protein
MTANNIKSLQSRSSIIASCFFSSVAAILIFAATFKVLYLLSHDRALLLPDPVFLVPAGQVLTVAAFIEVLYAVTLLIPWDKQSKLTLLTGLAGSFIIYRVGIATLGAARPCRCLGDLGDRFGLTADVVNDLTFGLLIYIASGVILLWVNYWLSWSRSGALLINSATRTPAISETPRFD